LYKGTRPEARTADWQFVALALCTTLQIFCEGPCQNHLS